MSKNQRYNILLAILLIALLFTGMAVAGNPGEYAIIHSDPSLENMIQQQQLPPDYKYYYAGRSNLPYAVIGIDPKYKLISKYWYKIKKDLVADKVSHLMPTGAIHITYGRILDSDDIQIGLWFSEYYHTIIQFESGNELKIFNPYEPNDSM